ncbi:hypothetical protein BZG36_04036 [Bifiguratus adelaidae]|uniref:YCII-related domain-containing protein n=1 Tax=Bifiguratus adelaidae TaxID=1938954 RepID=A0A261Y043_9FUNG|nr:hypothetical protein BZG36_04036 [Bifiguratus adelaidae]
MATTGKHAFLVLTYDAENDETALERRLVTRPRHFAHANKIHKEDFLHVGGAILRSHEPVTVASRDTPVPDMKGSFILCYADSAEEVEERLKADPYVTEGVWKRWDIVPVLQWQPEP